MNERTAVNSVFACVYLLIGFLAPDIFKDISRISGATVILIFLLVMSFAQYHIQNLIENEATTPF